MPSPAQPIILAAQDELQDPAGIRWPATELVQHLHDTFPQAADVPIEFAWAGAIDTCSRFSAFWGSVLARLRALA